MKNSKISKELQQKALKILNDTEDKSQAIFDVIDMFNTEINQNLVEQLREEDEEMKARNTTAEKLGLRTSFTQEERHFYDLLKSRETITADDFDIIPEDIIDRTLDDIKAESTTLNLIQFAPAHVQKWLVADKSGVAQWGGLTDELSAELSAEITSLDLDLNKLHVMLVIPKAIRDLAMPYVDAYFTAILNEAMHDGLCDGFINGDGKNAPIGILKKIGEFNSDGTAASKDVLDDIEGFTPKDLAEVYVTLSKNGLRAVNGLKLIANPVDVYRYVTPALTFQTPQGYVSTAKDDIEVIEEPMCPEGTAIFTLDQMYVMGMQGIDVVEYKETKAIEDCDLIIAKVYANGRPVDDSTAVPFDVTKLKPYVMPVVVKSDSADRD